MNPEKEKGTEEVAEERPRSVSPPAPANPPLDFATSHPWSDIRFVRPSKGIETDGSPEGEIVVEQVKEMQRETLKGFTIAQLNDMGCWVKEFPFYFTGRFLTLS